MRRVLVGLALLGLVACGGSGGDSATEALRDTARNLDDIRSARLDLRLTADAQKAEPVGFAMSGRFALPKAEGLPVADVEVTELRGSRESAMRFVSTGDAAWVVRDGKAVGLSGGGGVNVGGEGGGLGELRIDSWLRDPALTEGDDGTDRITAGLNVATAFDDLGRLGDRLGAPLLGGLRPLDDTGRRALERSARDSTIEVWTDDDRLLRRLELTVTLTAAGEVPSGLRSLVPVTLSLSLDLADVNRPVTVDPPV